MILPRFVRKILAVFRGSVSPVFIVLSVALGLWFGLVPGWSGFHTAIVLLVLVLNIHTGLFLLSAAVGKSLCLAAAPLLFHIGVGVQNYLSPLLNLLASIPLIGITDFSRYSVAAAIVVGPVIGLAAGLLLARAVTSFRRMLLKFEEGSEQFKKWYSSRWVRILDRLLIGKRTKDAKALFTAKTRIVRKAGAAVAALVLFVSVIATTLVKDSMIKDYTTKTMTKANGAEVNVESLDLSVLTGAVSVSGIQVTDATKPQNNQVSIEEINADASMYNLLIGKLVMDNVEVSNVKFNQKRDTPGKIVEAKIESKPSVFDPCNFKVEAADLHKLEGYFKDAKAVKEWLQKLSKWLPKAKEKAVTGPEEVPQKYLDYLDARAVVPPSPRVLAKRIKLDNVEIPSQLFGNSSVLLKNISDSPQAAKLPVTLEIKSHDTGAFVNITFDYASDEQRPRVSGTFDGFDLSKIQSNLSRNSALVFEKGTASGRFEGTVTNEAVDLTINVGISDMKAKAQGKEVFGLSSKTTSGALGVLENLSATIRVVGPANELRLAFDVKALQENLKKALVKAGKERLAQEIDKQIGERLDEKLGDKIPSEIKEALKQPKKLIEGLGGLFRKKDDNKEE